jgi:hypothetical protein
MSARPSASELLRTEGALLTRSRLRELGFERRAIDSAFRSLPMIFLPGYSRRLVRVADHPEPSGGRENPSMRWPRFISFTCTSCLPRLAPPVARNRPRWRARRPCIGGFPQMEYALSQELLYL